MNDYKIFALGGAGGMIANTLLINKFPQDRLFLFNTDKAALDNSPLVNKFQVGMKLTGGLGSAASPVIGKQAFEEDKDMFKRLSGPDCLYIIVGGLGGGTCTGISGKLAHLLSESKRRFVLILTLPFLWEGKKRNAQSIEAVSEINQYTDKLILLNNADLRHKFGVMRMAESFSNSNFVACEIIKEVIYQSEFPTITNKSHLPLTPKLEDVILRIKEYIRDHEYLISTQSSRIIVPDTNKELLKALSIDPDFVYKISPRKFEELIEYIYKMSGCETKLTKQSRDNGADLLVWSPPPVFGNPFLTVIQTKRYQSSKKVGSAEIRELIGTQITFNAEKAQIITTSDYSKPAIATAKSSKIDLMKFYELTDTIKSIINS